MTGCHRPLINVIENEIIKDLELNNLKCVAKLVGYIIDSYDGYAANKKRYRTDMMPYPPHLIVGKKFKGRYLIKVSECLEKDVMNTLIDSVKFGQKAASTVFRNFISALEEVHKANMIHRDLKPENCMFVNNSINNSNDLNKMDSKELEIKLIDFGACVYLPPDKTELLCEGPLAGTALYLAPETLNRRVHSKATDIWQAGVTLWVILFQKYPFSGEVSIKSYDGNLQFQTGNINISENCKDLFRKIFTVDPKDRITSHDILKHSWIRDFANLPDDDFGEDYRRSVKEWIYRKKVRMAIEHEAERCNLIKSNILDNILQKAQCRLEITTMTYRSLQKSFLREISHTPFSELSKQQSQNKTIDDVNAPYVLPKFLTEGISYLTFCKILSENNLHILATEEVYHMFDMHHSGLVDYFEFLSVLASFRENFDDTDLLNEQSAKFYFEMFDYDCSEEISRFCEYFTCYHILSK